MKNAEECEAIANSEAPAEEKAEKLAALHKKAERSYNSYIAKPTIEDAIPPMEEFLREQALREVASISTEPEVEDKLISMLNNAEECETQFYGFLWHHPLRKSPDYEGNRTFEMFRERGEPLGYVEMILKSVTKQTSKKNKDVHYWLVKAEDANGEEAFIQVWEDDWKRFGPELKEGELVKMKVKPPDKGFNRYTLWAPKKWPKWEYDKLIPKDRAFDLRLVPLRKGE